MAKKRSSSLTPNSWWQLRIELLGVEPRVWRRVIVPEAIPLPKLDRVIQVSLGWTNQHLHEFVIGGVRYGAPDPEFARELAHVEEKKVALNDALGSNARCFDYVYDFGDEWRHAVLVEETHVHATEISCTAGENACPPEDVGGPPGYARFLQAITDRQHAEHREMLDWVGGSFNAGKFDIVAVNRGLAEI